MAPTGRIDEPVANPSDNLKSQNLEKKRPLIGYDHVRYWVSRVYREKCFHRKKNPIQLQRRCRRDSDPSGRRRQPSVRDAAESDGAPSIVGRPLASIRCDFEVSLGASALRPSINQSILPSVHPSSSAIKVGADFLIRTPVNRVIRVAAGRPSHSLAGPVGRRQSANGVAGRPERPIPSKTTKNQGPSSSPFVRSAQKRKQRQQQQKNRQKRKETTSAKDVEVIGRPSRPIRTAKSRAAPSVAPRRRRI